MNMKIAAVVIWYNPEDLFAENLKSYAGHADTVIVIDNSQNDNAKLLKGIKNVHYEPLHHNVGIAAALNHGFEKARALGAEWVLSMDQDSAFDDRDIALLLGTADSASTDVAVIGHQDRGARAQTFKDVDRVITSGCINRLSAYTQIGGFNEPLFIDQVDFDYCYRLRSANFRILKNLNVKMHHEMGEAEARQFRRRAYTTYNYNATRRYYQVRNRLYMRKTFPQYEIKHIKNILREIRNVLLFEGDKVSKLAAMTQGAWHYAIGRYGPR